jgi:Ni/Co efflux regulator RcnB
MMKTLLISVAAGALLFGAAQAAPENDNNRRHRDHPAAQSEMNGPRANRDNDRANARTNTEARIDAHGRNNGNDRTDRTVSVDRTVTRDRNRNMRNVDVNRNVTVNRDVNVNRNVTVNRDVNVNRNVDVNRNFRVDRNRRSNFSVSVYQRNVTAPRRYHYGTYHAPRGYHYTRYSYGQRLPALYFASNFWLSDFVNFGLMAPPDGYVWVRYGDDAVLVDRYTGEILQVQYNVFY